MSPYDKRAKRLQAVERDLLAGRITEEQAQAKRRTIMASKPAFVARWDLGNGKEGTKTFSTAKEAERYETKMRDKVAQGEAADPKPLRASILEIMEYHYTRKLAAKASRKSARAHVEHCRELLGPGLTFEKVNRHPVQALQGYFDGLREAKPKSFASDANIWNHHLQMSAAVQYWITVNRMNIANPLKVIEVAKPDNRREQAPTREQYERLLLVASHKRYPSWLPYFLICGWEVAPRISEILSWRWEGYHERDGQDLPWVRSYLAKKGKPVWRELPITDEAAQALADLPAAQKEHGRIWPLTERAVSRWVRQAFDDAGMEAFRFHDFRRSWKRRYLGASSKLTAELTGHTEAMDDRYTVLGRRELQEVYKVAKNGEK